MDCSRLPQYAAKTVCAVFCADFLTMLLMNVGRLYVAWLPFLFFASLGIFGTWIFRSDLIPASPARWLTASQRRSTVLLALLAALLMAGVRLPYLLESHLHRLAGPVVYDDTWHFQEINSLVHSVRYPAQCSLIPNRYFSFYYAPWMMVAAIYLALPVHGFTIKAAFAVGCAIYQTLICLTLLYVGFARARSRRHLFAAIYLIGLWGGAESIFAPIYYLSHNPWWIWAPQMPIHFPILFSGLVSAPHHITAALALVLCWHIWDIADDRNRKLAAVCSVLIAYAFYSSVFVFLSAIPLGIGAIVFTARKDYRNVLTIAFVSAVLIWPLLWLYLGKSQDVRFLVPFIANIHQLLPYAAALKAQATPSRFPGWFAALGAMASAFTVFLAYLCLNFSPLVLLLALYGKKLGRKDTLLAATAVLFILSTYFVGFPEGDNYASRGYVVPIFVLGWICAGLLPHFRTSVWVIIALFLGSFGLLHKFVFTYKSALHAAHGPRDAPDGQAILSLNQDRGTRTASGRTVSELSLKDPDQTYYVEKFVEGGRPHPGVADRQLECAGPHGPWRWQRIPQVP